MWVIGHHRPCASFLGIGKSMVILYALGGCVKNCFYTRLRLQGESKNPASQFTGFFVVNYQTLTTCPT